MIQRILFRILMAPLALLYGLGVACRNFLYKIGILKEISFQVPVISIGNLTVGGAGKSPHIEWLAGFLMQYLEVATLSRGYGRSTRGFLEVNGYNRVNDVGDEPLQFKRKYPSLGVFVSESRVLGIPQILNINYHTQVILLDDAFQHRAVKPYWNILLIEYSSLFTDDYLLPMGRLREWKSAYKRADTLIITKCPDDLIDSDRETALDKVKPKPGQEIFFTKYEYGRPYHLFFRAVTHAINEKVHVLVVCAIANSSYMMQYVENQAASVKLMEYEDHHLFTRYEIAQLKKQFDQIEAGRKIILTTEKDAVRLERHLAYLEEQNMPIFVLPVHVSFYDAEDQFRELVKVKLLDFKS